MQALFVYFLKACLYSGILFLYYFIALRNKQFHYYNRFYLLMSVTLSLFLPFLNIEIWQWRSNNQQVVQLMNVMLVNGGETSNNASNLYFSPEIISLVLITSVAICLLTILCINILKIFRFRNKYPVEVIHDINFITTDLSQAPFSFFNNLFWKNTLNPNDATGQQILKHEMTHIQEKHSWDKVFMRIVTSIFWLNPTYWLIQKELSMIHEFIADEKAIEDKNAEAFAMMLLQSQYSKMVFSPAQSFSYSPIKRRLLMLTTSRKPSFTYARRIAVLPLLAASVLLFAFTIKKDKQQQRFVRANAPFVLVVDAGHGGDDDGAVGLNDVLEKNINLTIAKKIEELAPGYDIKVFMTRNEDRTTALKDRMDFIKSLQPDATVSVHVNVATGQQTDKNEVGVHIPRDENNPNYQQSRLLGSGLLQAIKGDFPVNSVLLQRKNMGIYVIDQNPYPAAIIECGYMNNAESLKGLQDDATTTKMAKDILAGVANYANNKQPLSAVTIIDTIAKTPLYYVDDKETSAEEARKIDANRIESINVLKDSEATKKYGDKGKNGVVLIKLKTIVNSNSKAAHITLDGNHYDSTKVPLYIVDGKEKSKVELNTVSPDKIESISVLKGDDAIKKYGDKGKNGVIEIQLKNGEDKQPVIYFQSASDTITETSASFPGGNQAWREYLTRQLRNNIVDKGPKGSYTVVVSFVVGEDGNISNVKALNDAGYGTAKEAVRVIESGPKWIPAKRDGKAVTTETKQSITWQKV